MALRQLHAEMQDNQAQVVSSLEAVAVALPDVDRFKQLLRNASGQQSELISALSKASDELESMRETVGVRLKSLQSEQGKTNKVLEAWNSRLKEMGQTVATVATLETEQAAIRNEVADWRSRFEAAYDVFAQYVRAEGQAADQVDSPPGHGQTIGSRATPVYKDIR